MGIVLQFVPRNKTEPRMFKGILTMRMFMWIAVLVLIGVILSSRIRSILPFIPEL